MTNLDSILKRRDITLPTKVHLIKAMLFKPRPDLDSNTLPCSPWEAVNSVFSYNGLFGLGLFAQAVGMCLHWV